MRESNAEMIGSYIGYRGRACGGGSGDDDATDETDATERGTLAGGGRVDAGLGELWLGSRIVGRILLRFVWNLPGQRAARSFADLAYSSGAGVGL